MQMIDVESIVKIHDQIINKFGGLKGIKDYGALESSINNAFSTFGGEDLYKTDLEKISNIFQLLIKNHCFLDANKRTAVTIFNLLTKVNNVHIQYKIQDLEQLALDIAESNIDEQNIKQWIQKHKIKNNEI